jgi:hypothetical protein
LGAADSSDPELETTGAGAGLDAFSPVKDAGSRIVERRRGCSDALALAEYSDGAGAGRSSVGGE